MSVYEIFEEGWFQNGVWIYSDPHFSDNEIKKMMGDWPTNEELIGKINSKVGRKDTLIILGDIGDIESVRKLRGYKVLIMGNHDSGASNYKRKSVKKLFNKTFYSVEQVKKEMEDNYPNWKLTIVENYNSIIALADNLLFDEVYEGPLIIGEKIILSHEPIPNLTWAFNIHGHSHGSKENEDKWHLNICSDVVNYEPINLKRLLKKGVSSGIQNLHRITIDKATQRKSRKK